MSRYPKGYMGSEVKVGDRFGKLVVMEVKQVPAGSLQCPERTTIGVLCLCDCGKELTCPVSRLRGGIKGCRCRRVDYGKAKLKGKIRGQLEAFSSCLLSAKRRKINFNLSLEEFAEISDKDCYYCGTPPSRTIDKYIFNGVDRLDNSQGYSVSNGVPSCKKCNLAKHIMKESEFYEWVRRVYEHTKER